MAGFRRLDHCAAMTKRNQAPIPTSIIAEADAAGVALHALTAALPKQGEAPEWITIFPQLGRFKTRDGRTFTVDAATLMAVFVEDGIDLPVDINHATDGAQFLGTRSDAVGWIVELRIVDGALQGRVDWLDEGRELLSSRKYRYISPSFYRDDENNATRLKAAALVTAPAIARQPALASASSPEPSEFSMKSIAAALGLNEGADEASCLSALNSRLTGSVSKEIHEQALTQLSAATTELAGIKDKVRAGKVESLISEALSAKKITPAEKDHFVALCASDEGLASVEKLFAAKTPLLPASGLDDKDPPGGSDADASDPVKLAELAAEMQDKEALAGRRISMAEAMTRVLSKNA